MVEIFENEAQNISYSYQKVLQAVMNVLVCTVYYIAVKGPYSTGRAQKVTAQVLIKVSIGFEIYKPSTDHPQPMFGITLVFY